MVRCGRVHVDFLAICVMYHFVSHITNAALPALNSSSSVKEHCSNFSIDSLADYLPQEQRLAVQIITSDSGDLSNSYQIIDSSVGATKQSPGHSPKPSYGAEFAPYKLDKLESQLPSGPSITSQGPQQPLIPKRIVINLDTTNSNATETNSGGTKLTIGFAPTKQEHHSPQPTSPAAAMRSSSGSRKTLVPGTGGNGVSRLNKDSTRGNLMEAIRRQGGIPTVIMSDNDFNRIVESRNGATGESTTFMLNSEMVDERQRAGSAQGTNRNKKQPVQPSESSTASGDDSLGGRVMDLSDELGYLDQQLDGTRGTGDAYHSGTSRSAAIAEEGNRHQNPRNMEASLQNYRTKDNRIRPELGRAAEFDHETSVEPMVSGYRNEEDGDEERPRGGSENSVVQDRDSSRRLSHENRGDKFDRNSINSHDNNYSYDIHHDGSASMNPEPMDNSVSVRKRRQRDSKVRLSSTRTEEFGGSDVDGTTQASSDNNEISGVDGNLNELSAGVIGQSKNNGNTAPNSGQLTVKSKSKTDKSALPPTNQATDERVARILNRLKLYTTKDQLMKVAKNLQMYPSREESLASSSDETSERDNSDNDFFIGRNSEIRHQRNNPRIGASKVIGKKPLLSVNYGDGRDVESSSRFVTWRDRLEMARRNVPPPANHDSADSMVSEASSSSDSDDSENAPTDSERGSTDGETGDGMRLLSEFRQRQQRMREMKESAETDAEPESNVVSRMVSGSGKNYEPEPSNSAARQHQAQPGDDQEASEGEPQTATNDRDDTTDYTSANDLVDGMRHNAKLYNEDDTPEPRRSGKESAEDSELDPEVADESEPSPARAEFEDGGKKSDEKEEAEIKILEHVIDELVNRERKDSGSRDSGSSGGDSADAK